MAVLNHLFEPQPTTDDYKFQIERTLHKMLLVMLGAAGVYAGAIISQLIPSPSNYSIGPLLFGLLLISYLIFRMGYVRLAAWMAPLSLWFSMTLSIAGIGGITATTLAGYILSIFLATFLPGKQAGLFMTALSLVSGVLLYIAQINHLLGPRFDDPTTNMVGQFLLLLVAGATFLLIKQRLDLAFRNMLFIQSELTAQNQKLRDEINQRERLTHELDSSTNLYKMLAENTSDFVAVHEADGRVSYISPSIERATGFSLDEFRRMKPEEIMHPDDVLPTRAACKHIFQGNRLDAYQLRIRTRQGTYVWVESRCIPIRDQSGTVQRFIAGSRVITDHKVTEQALRSHEELFKTVINHAPVAIGISTPDYKVLALSDYLLNLVGYTREDFIGKQTDELPFWDQQDLNTIDQHLAAHGAIHGLEMTWKRKDGTPVEILASFQQVVIAEQPYVLGFGVDITERKLTETERLSTERLKHEVSAEREILSAQEQFLSRVAHDLRVPLAVIRTSGAVLRNHYERLSTDRRDEHFDRIDKQVVRIDHLIEDVLTIGRAKAGKMEFGPTPTDVLTLCQDCMEQVMLTDQQAHPIHFQRNYEFGLLMMDKALMEKIIINLLSNAVKYSPPHSSVNFMVDCQAGDLVLTIQDCGIGIPEADISRLFDPFFRSENARDFTKGTGLGLAIVQEAVHAHNGTITCQSVVNSGTTFTVRLPMGIDCDETPRPGVSQQRLL
jgi:PAS domain S-box-containing protein